MLRYDSLHQARIDDGHAYSHARKARKRNRWDCGVDALTQPVALMADARRMASAGQLLV
jgi:hypothetical protein